MSTNLRLPDDLMAKIREIAAQEERPLNTQLIRFIRAGVERYEAAQRGTKSESEA